MKKRIVSILLTLCMVMSVMGTAVFAASGYEDAREIVRSSDSKITVSNDTTEETLTHDLQALIPDDSSCTVIVEIISKVNATTDEKGSITAKIYIRDEKYNYTNSGDTITYYIPVAEQNEDEVSIIENAEKAVEEAFEDYISSVTVTKDNILSQKKELLSVAEKAAGSVKTAWHTTPLFATAMPKDGENGYIRGILKLTFGAEVRDVVLSAIIYEDGSAAMYGSEKAAAAENAAKPTEEPTAEPAAQETPAETASIPKSGTAYPSTQIVDIDGSKVTFEMYALLDEDGNPTNYIKARDLAFALDGTIAQFEVDWNGAVNLLSGMPYTSNGSENNTPFSGERQYTIPENPTNVNGAASDLIAIFLTDDTGGGYTYYQLRDLGKKLEFNVGWSSDRGIFVETDKEYQE